MGSYQLDSNQTTFKKKNKKTTRGTKNVIQWRIQKFL